MSDAVPYNKALRDFVYLDWEKIRSLAAQILEGLPSEGKEERRHEAGAKARLEANLLSLLKGGGEADYRYFSSTNETRSFHHHIYSLFESALLEQGLITLIDAKFSEERWKQESFHDGQFILASGPLRIMDYGWVASFMESMPQIQRMLDNAESYTLKKKQDAREVTQRDLNSHSQQRAKVQKELKSLKLNELADLARRFHGEGVRVKVVPDKDNLDKLLVGTGQPANFYDTAESLSRKYGVEIDADWVVLGQVNMSNSNQEPMRLPIGNEMEDAFEGMFFFANSVIRMAGAVQFPVVSFTPISIYRAVNY